MKAQVDEKDIIARCLSNYLYDGNTEDAEAAAMAYVSTYMKFCVKKGHEKEYLEYFCKTILEVDALAEKKA